MHEIKRRAMEEHKKETGLHPIIVWIIASILLHILLILISIVLHIDDYRIATHEKKEMMISAQDKQNAIMMLDQPKKPLPVKSFPQQQPSKPIPKPIAEKPVAKQQVVEPPTVQPAQPAPTFTLIPGRQGLDEQNITDNISDIPTQLQPKKPKTIDTKPVPQEPTESKLDPIISPPAPKQKEDHVADQDAHLKPKTSSTSNSKTLASQEEKTTPKPFKNDAKQTTQDKASTEQTEPLQVSLSPKTAALDMDDPYQFVPKQSQKQRMSLKDLQLGFNNHLQNVGNTQSLIQHGNTSAVPDGDNLKAITYRNNVANTMTGSIHTHPKYPLIQYIRGKKTGVSITVDRQGKLLEAYLVASSDNPLMDQIMLEAIQSAGLYPTAPSCVSGDPIQQQWVIIH